MTDNNLEPTSGRTPDGRFAGAKGLNRPYRRHAETVRMLTEKYTPEELLQLNEDPHAARFTALEIIALRQIVNAMRYVKPESNADVRAEREALLDRLEPETKNEKGVAAGVQVVVNINSVGGAYGNDRAQSDGSTAQQDETIDVRIARQPQISDAGQSACSECEGPGNADGKQGQTVPVIESED